MHGTTESNRRYFHTSEDGRLGFTDADGSKQYCNWVGGQLLGFGFYEDKGTKTIKPSTKLCVRFLDRNEGAELIVRGLWPSFFAYSVASFVPALLDHRDDIVRIVVHAGKENSKICFARFEYLDSGGTWQRMEFERMPADPDDRLTWASELIDMFMRSQNGDSQNADSHGDDSTPDKDEPIGWPAGPVDDYDPFSDDAPPSFTSCELFGVTIVLDESAGESVDVDISTPRALTLIGLFSRFAEPDRWPFAKFLLSSVEAATPVSRHQRATSFHDLSAADAKILECFMVDANIETKRRAWDTFRNARRSVE